MKGFVREIFTSIQGEGIRVGTRMTFVRFSGCNLACNYCDTPDTQIMTGDFLYEGKTFQNPVDVDFVLDKVAVRDVAVTGGEPLLQVIFLHELCDRLSKNRKVIYLDTNGSLPDNLGQVVDYFDTICLDFKIPSATGRSALWKEHEQSLAIADKRNVFVKIVVNEHFLPVELEKVCAIILHVNRTIPLVIQPVFGCEIPGILDIQQRALEQLNDVRIIPQVHKCLNIR